MRHFARERSETTERNKAAGQKTIGNEAYRRGPESVNRSLDHGIGVRIPASQPDFALQQQLTVIEFPSKIPASRRLKCHTDFDLR